MPYHISNKGMLTPCKAKPGKCPLGGKHFQNEEQGMEYLDNINNKETLIENYKSASTPLERTKIATEIQTINQELGLNEYEDIPSVKTNVNEEVYNELASKYTQDMKKFAEKSMPNLLILKLIIEGKLL